jgi:enoyl-CoA hydratase/carnithine racemase
MPGQPPTSEHLRLTVEGRIARLTLARPAVLNALSFELLEDLVAACRWLESQDAVRVVVLAGEGRGFSSGVDLSGLTRLLATDGSARDAADAGNRAATAIEAVPQITIASIHGWCVGGGLVLALACDLRVAAASSRFSIPEIDLGLPLAWGGVPRLLREVGPAVARDLVLTGREFDAGEALRLGVVSRVLADDRLEDEVAEVAAELATKARLPVRATLDAVAAHAGLGTPVGGADADLVLAAVDDPECREAAERSLTRLFGRDPGR